MKRKIRYIVRADEVTVTRKAGFVLIEYKEEGVPPIHLQIGPRIAGMSDAEIVELYNDCLRGHARLAAECKHVVVEVPLGSAQIEHSPEIDQWVPRGDVLRCLIREDEKNHVVVEIDDKEFELEQFGKLLSTYAGWAMRIEFVPEEDVHRRPICEVREPETEQEN